MSGELHSVTTALEIEQSRCEGLRRQRDELDEEIGLYFSMLRKVNPELYQRVRVLKDGSLAVRAPGNVVKVKKKKKKKPVETPPVRLNAAVQTLVSCGDCGGGSVPAHSSPLCGYLLHKGCLCVVGCTAAHSHSFVPGECACVCLVCFLFSFFLLCVVCRFLACIAPDPAAIRPMRCPSP